MRITIDIDTERETLSAYDKGVLRALAGDVSAPSTTAETLPLELPEAKPEPIVKAPAPKAAPKAPVKAAQAKEQAPEPEVAPSATEEPEPEPEATPEPEAAPEPTPAKAKANTTSTDLPVMELLVRQAAELISSGERARVKVALDAVGAARVSEVTPEQADAFMKALG